MNKCEIEDCELCAPLKGKYYHHAYENAKNVRFCNSNKTATIWNASKCIFRVVQNELQFYFATGPDTVLILNCYFTSYILIAVIIATFSECKGFACKIKAQRKACKGHFKVREQSRPCASQTSRKRCPLVLIEGKTTADQSEFNTLTWTNQNS